MSEESSSIASSRSKRNIKDRHGRKAAFECLRELKGAKHKYDIGTVDKVYDEVEEKEYAKRRQNRMEEDWIVDDDGSGYVEDGREIFDEDEYDDVNAVFTSKKGKEKSLGKNKGVVKELEDKSSSGNLKRMLANMPTKKRKIESKELTDVEKAILEECLLEDGSRSVLDMGRRNQSMPNFAKRKAYQPKYEMKRKELRPVVINEERKTLKPINRMEKSVKDQFYEKETCPSMEPAQSDVGDPIIEEPMSDPPLKEEENNFSDDDEELIKNICDEVEETLLLPETKSFPINRGFAINGNVEKKTSLISTWESTRANSELVDNNDLTMQEVHIDSSQLPFTTNNEGKQVLRIYWLDAYEDYFLHPGIVYLFGKVWVEEVNAHVSCCITVKNIERKIFLLPRLKRLNLKTKEEGEELTLKDIYDEFNSVIAIKFKILQFKSRKVIKNYCFEKSDVPNEAEYCEIRYSAEYPALPQTLEGETFSHVFGSNSSSLELLLVERKIKGPCWLDVHFPQPSSPPVSWCKLETIASDPSFITPVSGLPPPPLIVMSLCLRTSINAKTHQNEIALMGCLVHTKFPIDKAAPKPLYQSHFCALTKPLDVVWPWDLKIKLQTYTATKIEKSDSERGLLGFILAKFHKIDPDIIIGHDILGFDLTVLMHRIQANKIPHWSKLGRLKRTQMPKLSSKGFAERTAVCGRLLCDAKLSAKELIRSKSYDLGPLVKQVLRVKEEERLQISVEEVRKCYSGAASLLQLVNATMQDAVYTLRIVSELNVLPLALQITNIAGNVMSRTLLGGRSERNEFLLLHAFADKNFICPNKQYGKGKVSSAFGEESKEENLVAMGKNSRKKPSYAGGLVLEPKKGFYDKYILLMDFNSLYPSIIQEFNICFTTVPSVKNASSNQQADDDLPELPDPDSRPGILPTEIRKLVESRREVKKLMKNTDLTAELKQQYDIRQKALKLTANSMYGCLGFSNSRFFAKHLAALITGKGREILLHTRDLVQKLNFEVIYGDTDSIMINTNSSDYDQVFKLGNKIKMEVNKLYKQLELDIDGVFKYMLLLKKKKYAAISITKLPNGEVVEDKEFKGLDIVRRDWSQFASDAGKHILDQVLSEQGPDERIENIHNHLEKLKEELQSGKISLDVLSITKQLTKNPLDYPDKNSLPHVQVALRVNSKGGKMLRQGDTVPYVICEDGSSQTAIQRAFHVDEVRANGNLKIDIQYYLSQQIHPVIARLCDPIEGIDSARIAESLGLDHSAYRSTHSNNEDEEIKSGDISDEERFRLCERFSFRCPAPNCQILVTLDGSVRGMGSSAEFLLQSCPNPKCKSAPYMHCAFIANKIRQEIKKHITTYYNGWLICEDPGCSNRTRRIPLKFHRGFPVCNVCNKGILFREYSESQLYKQLSFYDYIFDYQKGCQINKDLRHKSEVVKRAYYMLRNEVMKHLKMNAYSLINLGRIFSNLYIKPSSNRG